MIARKTKAVESLAKLHGATTSRTYDDRPATCASCVYRRGGRGLHCSRWDDALGTGGEVACVAFVGWGR